MGKVYYDKDGDINVVRDKVVAIIGYGNQGRSQALNMRDSGVQNIIVGSIRQRGRLPHLVHRRGGQEGRYPVPAAAGRGGSRDL